MAKLIEVNSPQDILPDYRNTPIGLLMEYHNLNKTFRTYDHAQLLMGMCMDNRKSLWIPENFAFVIRAGGANLFFHEFQVSYAIGVGGVKHIVLIGHNHCGMEKLDDRKAEFIEGMVRNAGWKAENAASHFENLSPFFEIGNAIEFLLCETDRLRKRYPKVKVAPLYFDEDSGKLMQIVPE